ncbi:MAG: hypothetical protein ACQ9MH_04770 [Nitrospinales bacterium]
MDSAHSHENDQDIDQRQAEIVNYAHDKWILHRHDDESDNAPEHVNAWGIVRIAAAVESVADHIDEYVSLTPHNHADVLDNAH